MVQWVGSSLSLLNLSSTHTSIYGISSFENQSEPQEGAKRKLVGDITKTPPTAWSAFVLHLLLASSSFTYCANNTDIAVFGENNRTYFHQAHPTMRRVGQHYAGESRVALHAISQSSLDK